MSLRRFPLDVSRLTGFTCVWAPEVRVDRVSGEVRTDRATGQPTYSVGVACRIPDEREADVLDIQVIGAPVGLVEGAAVRVFDLELRPWEVDGRSGFSFRASAITIDAPAASQSAETPAVGKAAGGKAAAS